MTHLRANVDDVAPAPDWYKRAACIGKDPDLFIPERRGPVHTATAKAVCADCPVRAECLDFALRHTNSIGIWGGTDEAERKRMRTARAV